MASAVHAYVTLRYESLFGGRGKALDLGIVTVQINARVEVKAGATSRDTAPHLVKLVLTPGGWRVADDTYDDEFTDMYPRGTDFAALEAALPPPETKTGPATLGRPRPANAGGPARERGARWAKAWRPRAALHLSSRLLVSPRRRWPRGLASTSPGGAASGSRARGSRHGEPGQPRS